MLDSYKVCVEPRAPSNLSSRPYIWCHDQFGRYGDRWSINRYQNYDVYVFKNKDDYMLFALTWGKE